MKVGDVIRAKKLSHVDALGNKAYMTTDFKPPRGKVFVVLLLGVEDIDGKVPVDPKEVLGRMGWQPKSEADHTCHELCRGRCHASPGDGECFWKGCPQVKEGEPEKTGRTCPLPWVEDDGD
jgi:hypothetical protein